MWPGQSTGAVVFLSKSAFGMLASSPFSGLLHCSGLLPSSGLSFAILLELADILLHAFEPNVDQAFTQLLATCVSQVSDGELT